MIPDLQAALVCEDVRLEVSGANSLVGVVSAIPTPVLPFRVMKLCVFTRWCSGLGDFQQTTRLLNCSDEEELARSETQFQLQNTVSHATNIALFGGMEFTEAGDYPVEIILDGELKLRFPLRVVKVDKPSHQ